MANSDNSTDQQAETESPSTSSSYTVPDNTVTQASQTAVTPGGNRLEGELSKLTEHLSLEESIVKSVHGQKKAVPQLEPLFTNQNQGVRNEVSTSAGNINSTPSKSKKKNAKKRERLKHLKLSQAAQPSIANSSPQSAPELPMTDNVKELFTRHMSAYAQQSHYLDNLSHHPQYQLMQNLQAREMYQQQPHNVSSAPNSPLVQPTFNTAYQSYHPDMVQRQVDPCTPRHLQNMMQHPLFNKSYSVDSYNHYQPQLGQQQSPRPSGKKTGGQKQKTPNNRQRNRTKSNELDPDDKKFGSYMTIEEVEQGLKNKTLFEGIIRINPKQFTHAYIASKDRDDQDILIEGITKRNRALEGDVVVVELVEYTPELQKSRRDSENATGNGKNDTENGETSNPNECSDLESTNVDAEATSQSESRTEQKRGRVVYIKEKVHSRTCIGFLKLMPDKNRQRALFVPRDHRIPRLNIPFTNWPDNFYKNAQAYANTLFLAEIIDWSDSRFALGKLIKNIGQSGDLVAETRAILVQNELDITPFGQKYKHLYPRHDYKVTEDEIMTREDCRKLCIFSIDPSNCRDIDDAVSCRKLENGNYEIGVHISDVTHYLTEGTELDEKVAEKATTIYMVERAYHMLPDDLCMICSLFPGVDKLTFSVFWEITDNAEVLSHRFAKTVIHSCSQLAYEHAQAILEDKETDFPEIYNGFQYKDIYETIKTLGRIGAKFRRARFDSGALRIDQPKIGFHLDPLNGLPNSYWIHESKESHQLIEEFMLLANMTVAGRIYKDHPRLAFLRCHPQPSGFMLKQLAIALKPLGIDLKVESAGNLQQSILPYVGPDNEDPGRAMVLSMLCAKPMARAKYFCADGVDDDDFNHYALNVPLYTHFTSPIRRYADIMVHRLLAASLNNDTPNWEVDKVRMIAAQCNKQKYNTKKAGEMSSELYTMKYIEMHSPLVAEAVVVGVGEKFIDVIIVAMGLNKRIFFNNDFPGTFNCVKNKGGVKLSQMEVTWKKEDSLGDAQAKQIIQVFSIVKIEMRKGDDVLKVEMRLAKP